MFIHAETHDGPSWLITQAAHQGMAWQLAEHWGNRRFARPAPRWEVLAAVFLHDSGWNDFDRAPGVDRNGRPITFDRMPVARHLEIWRESIERAAAQSRYAGLLVAAHFGALAKRKLDDARQRDERDAEQRIEAYIAWSDECQGLWNQMLVNDPRFSPVIGGAQRDVNARTLSGCDRISVFLSADLGSPFTVEVPTADGGIDEVGFEEFERRRWRVRPWPFIGDRVRLQCEALEMDSVVFADADDLNRAMDSAPVRRLKFEIMRTSRAAG